MMAWEPMYLETPHGTFSFPTKLSYGQHLAACPHPTPDRMGFCDRCVTVTLWSASRDRPESLCNEVNNEYPTEHERSGTS